MLIERTSSGASFPMLPALRAALLFLPGPREGCNLSEPGVVFSLVVSYSCLIFVVWTLLEKVSTSSVMEAPVCLWKAAGLGEFLTCGSFGLWERSYQSSDRRSEGVLTVLYVFLLRAGCCSQPPGEADFWFCMH